MISIKVRPKDNINRVLSRFKASVMAEGTMKLVRKKAFFQKPSLERKLKREEAQRQRKKDEIKLLRKIESEESDWRGN